MELKDRVKLARDRKGLTQKGLAKKAHVTPQAVSQWENGETKSLDGVSLARAANATGVEALWLIAEEGPMYSSTDKEENTIIPDDLVQAWQHMDKKSRDHLLAIAAALAENKKI